MRGEPTEMEEERETAPEYTTHSQYSDSSVPVQHVGGSNDIPVGRIGSRSALPTRKPDPSAALLGTALEFTKHAPDADAQYAPRLTRIIAIPQEGLRRQSQGCEKRTHSREAGSRHEHQIPGSSAASSAVLNPSNSSPDESVQFLRAYAKALHAHSIRPAEFVQFLDGLNTLCMATDTTTDDLLHKRLAPDAASSIVHEYVKRANEAFFAPRGLKASLQSFSSILEALKIPTERGQHAGAVVSVLDRSSTAERRAQALHPWVEALEVNVPSQSSQTLMLREMGDSLRGGNCHQNGSPPEAANISPAEARVSATAEEHPDPPHSIPGSREEANHNFSQWRSGRPGFDGRANHFRGPWTPFGVPGNGPFGRRGHGPFGARGSGPFGRAGHSPFAPSSFGPHGPPNCGRTGTRANESCSPNTNDWGAWGENVGKLGEEFGKMMGEWGQQFGKRAEVWGQDVGRRAEAWGEEMSARASTSGAQNRDASGSAQAQVHNDDDPPPSYPDMPAGQELGVLYGDGKTTALDDDDEDTSSIFSDSSDSDSDSDSDDEEYVDTEAIFLNRIRSINEQADMSVKKGKKSPEDVAQERALAIEKAQNEKTASDLKMEEKNIKRAIRLSLIQKGRDLKKQHRQRKREMREQHVGKGKGKAKKSKEWREAKKDYKEKRKQLRREKSSAKKEWREARNERKKSKRERTFGSDQEEAMKSMIWVVIENCDT